MRLNRRGLTILEIAPGVNLERDVLAQSDSAACVSTAEVMGPNLFHPAPIR